MDAWMDRFMDQAFRWVFAPCLIIFVVAIGLGLITSSVWIYMWATSPPATTILLPLDEWACTKTETHTYTQMLVIDKVIVPNVVTTEVCVQYGMKRG